METLFLGPFACTLFILPADFALLDNVCYIFNVDRVFVLS